MDCFNLVMAAHLAFSGTNDLDQAIAIAFADTRILKLYLFSTTARSIGPPVKRAGHFGLPTFEKGNSMLNLIYRLPSDCGKATQASAQ